MSMLSLLAHHIRQHGSVPTARVSSAQARGRAKRYAYWGVARYEIRLTADGQPTNIACERASSDRRSRRLCDEDCDALCEREDRIRWEPIGRLSERGAAELIERIGCYSGELAKHRARRQELPALTLGQRLLVALVQRHHGMAREAAVQAVVDGRVSRHGRWLDAMPRGQMYVESRYVPYGDDRDAAVFAAETNQERRRQIVASCGERVVNDAARTLVQQDDFGRLYRDWNGRQIVRVVCPSTGAIYWLPVSYYCRTAKAAVAETFGLTVEEYSPAAEG